MPVRVLMVIGKMDRGGAETLIMNLYRNIDRNLVQFDFAVHTQEKGDYDDEITSLGGRIFHFPQYNIMNSISYRKAWDKFLNDHEGEFDFVHGHIGSCATIYLSAAKKAGIYTIAHSHNFVVGLEGLLFRILCFPQRFIADYFFGCSREAGIDRFGKNVVNNPSVYKTVNNGIKAEDYVYNSQLREKYRKEFGVEGKFVVGHIGRFVLQKNHHFLIDVFKEIKKIREDAVLILAGRGELEEKIRKYVDELNLTKDVIFSGVREDVPGVLQMFDLFVFPSIYEGLGIVAVEAQASGLPCILSDMIPDLACVTPNCKKISLKESPSKWAEKALLFYKNSKRENTYNLILENGFDIVGVAKELENFYIDHAK